MRVKAKTERLVQMSEVASQCLNKSEVILKIGSEVRLEVRSEVGSEAESEVRSKVGSKVELEIRLEP